MTIHIFSGLLECRLRDIAEALTCTPSSLITSISFNQGDFESSIKIQTNLTKNFLLNTHPQQNQVNTSRSYLINIQEESMTFEAEKELLYDIEIHVKKNGLTERDIQNDYGANLRLLKHPENILRFHKIIKAGRSCLPDKPTLPKEVIEAKIKQCILNLKLNTRKNVKTCCRYVCYVIINHGFWENSASYCLNKLKKILPMDKVKYMIGSDRSFSELFFLKELKELPNKTRGNFNTYKDLVNDLEEELIKEGVISAA